MARATHTSAVLAVSRVAYREIRARLEAAGYPVADGEPMDMHGLLVEAIPPNGGEVTAATEAGETTHIEVASLMSRRTKTGLVELTLNGERTQMDVCKAREVADMLLQAIEAATSDCAVWRLFTQRLGMTDAEASRALLDLRELRQGSPAAVIPH